MKNVFVAISIGFLLAGMPIVTSDCACETSEQDYLDTEQITSQGVGLSPEDIAVLQQQGEREGWAFTVGENAATKQALNHLCGYQPSENRWIDASFDPCVPTGDLPEHWDWRDVNGTDYTTPIKNQGGCGSCWAFATVAPLESAILIKDGDDVDLSEQWLVSCNRDGMGCNGGNFAHDYHKWKTDLCGDIGSVFEKEFPYKGNVFCNCPLNHTYLLSSWKYIGLPYHIPRPERIKQAMLTYGPIACAVFVNSAFQGYNGGVFNAHFEETTNHCVVLVGWDDHYYWNGNNYSVWFLRNSWGTNWGEEGYMNIVYECCRVGEDANYVDYRGLKIPPKTTLSIELKGGRGLTFHVTNVGNADALDVNWTAHIKGGFFGFIDINKSGTSAVLQPATLLTDTIKPFGLGFLEINVTTSALNAKTVTKNVKMVILAGGFIWYCLDCYC